MGKNYHDKSNKKDQRPNRSEKLSTTIGDLLRAKGETIPEAEKKDNKFNKANNKRKNNKSKSFKEKIENSGKRLPESTKELPVFFDMNEPIKEKSEDVKPQIQIKQGSWDELTKLFTSTEPEEDPTTIKDSIPENPNTFHIGAEYITKEGTDKKVSLSNFINKG